MQFQSELQDARIGRVVDRSKRRGAHVRIRVAEVRVIDGVERLEPRFEPHPFLNRKHAAERQIEIEWSRPAQGIAPDVPGLACRIRNKRHPGGSKPPYASHAELITWSSSPVVRIPYWILPQGSAVAGRYSVASITADWLKRDVGIWLFVNGCFVA